MSLTLGSRSSGSSGPRPNTSSTTSLRMTSRSLMLSGVDSSAIRSNSSVRISASARARSAFASASRFRRLRSLRWTLALSSRYCGRGASGRGVRAAGGTVLPRFSEVLMSWNLESEEAEERAALLGLLRLLVRLAHQLAREAAELRGEIRVIGHRQRHTGVERLGHRFVVARERLVDAVAERGLDLLRCDQVLIRDAVEQDLDAVAA